MSSARDIFAAASARRLPLRMRPDLVIVPQFYRSVRYWLVKDPLALRYFHLGEEEHAILKMLDGRASLSELQRRFEDAFAPRRITFDQITGFLSRLHDSSLLVAETPGQGAELLRRHVHRRRQAWMRAVGNILSIRFRGVDPEGLLRRLYPLCAWMFSRWFLLTCLILVVSALVLAAVEFDVLTQKLRSAVESFGARDLIGLAVALALAKCWHELGHAMTCKHFGGECHEIGLMLLVGTPCLYCDVSDAWLLNNKWHRIAISAAGILVEVFLASVCLFLWWLSEPGAFNTLLLNIVVICSLNTLLLNGNPLLRYDGYFILADFLETPNLNQQSRAMVNRVFRRLFIGGEAPADRYAPQRARLFVGLYGIASPVYRWCVVLGVLWILHRILEPHGLQVIAGLIAVMAILGMIAPPIARLGGRVFRPVPKTATRPGRVVWSVCLCLLLVMAGLFFPFPHNVSAPLVLQPQDGRYVYVAIPGRLIEAVEPGTQVEEGQLVARLASEEVDRELADLTSQRDQRRVRLESLRLRLLTEPGIAPQIPAAEETLADVNARLQQRQLDQQRLLIRAPAAGVVIAPPRVVAPPREGGALSAWSGALLEPKNRGAYLVSGTPVCAIGNPARLEAVLVVGQEDMEFVRVGQGARLKLASLPGRVLTGTVVEVAKTDLKVIPRELAAQGDLPVRQETSGTPRPATTSYQARVVIDDCPPGMLVGARGQAKILSEPRSLAQRLVRWLTHVFRLAL